MSRPAAPRQRTRRSRRPSAALVAVTAAIGGTLVYASTSSAASVFGEVLRGTHASESARADGAITRDDGVLPEGVTVFDDDYPGVANLEPGLLRALREAATDAAGSGIAIQVNSGWRSAELQDELFREAVAEHGSREEAARWVATSGTSAHVSGEAIDVGGSGATAWLSHRGARYGLCQIYANEPWHYEFRPAASDLGCPPPYPDPTHDPRMQQ